MTKSEKCDINIINKRTKKYQSWDKKVPFLCTKQNRSQMRQMFRKGEKNMNKYMEIVKNKSIEGFKNKEGGPFGAIITDREGNIIAEGNNRVLCSNDPTAHAEVVAIRRACEKLKTYNLSGYILYTSCEPCPMCLSAIIWTNIKKVYYGCTKEDAGNIGFRDDVIYQYLKGENKDLINLKQMDRDECIQVFDEYKNESGVIY